MDEYWLIYDSTANYRCFCVHAHHMLFLCCCFLISGQVIDSFTIKINLFNEIAVCQSSSWNSIIFELFYFWRISGSHWIQWLSGTEIGHKCILSACTCIEMQMWKVIIGVWNIVSANFLSGLWNVSGLNYHLPNLCSWEIRLCQVVVKTSANVL